jgi:hypothetical protein
VVRVGPGRAILDCSEAAAALLAPCRTEPGGRAGAGPDGVVGAQLDAFLQVPIACRSTACMRPWPPAGADRGHGRIEAIDGFPQVLCRYRLWAHGVLLGYGLWRTEWRWRALPSWYAEGLGVGVNARKERADSDAEFRC